MVGNRGNGSPLEKASEDTTKMADEDGSSADQKRDGSVIFLENKKTQPQPDMRVLPAVNTSSLLVST